MTFKTVAGDLFGATAFALIPVALCAAVSVAAAHPILVGGAAGAALYARSKKLKLKRLNDGSTCSRVLDARVVSG